MELPRPERQSQMSRAGLILGLYSLLAIVAILISAGRADVDIYRIAGTSTPIRLVLSPLAGVAVGLGVVFLSRLAVHRFEWARSLHRDFRALLGPLSTGEIAILALASAVGEELLFRGALLPWIGLLPQAAVFALLHVGPGARFLPWTVSAFAMGLVFGWLFLVTGDLGGAMTAHFTINYLNLGHIARVELPPASA
jgi:membrane protease YdiL (CAAX protease family)